MISDSAWTGFSPIRNPSIGPFKRIKLSSLVKASLFDRVAGWRASKGGWGVPTARGWEIRTRCSGWSAVTGGGELPRVVRGRTGRRASLACVIMVRSCGRTAGGVVPDAARCAAIGGARRRASAKHSACATLPSRAPRCGSIAHAITLAKFARHYTPRPVVRFNSHTVPLR